MDQSTHEVRRAQWRMIIEQCQSRPDGITVKQWLDENGISDKTYYYHLRKFRLEAYSEMKEKGMLAVQPIDNQAVTFAEIPIPTKAAPEASIVNHPVAVINVGKSNIAISNDISKELLSLIIQEASHA